MQHVLQSGNCLKGQCINFFDTFFLQKNRTQDFQFSWQEVYILFLAKSSFLPIHKGHFFLQEPFISDQERHFCEQEYISLSASLLLQAYNFSLRELLSPSKRTTISPDKSSTPPCKNTTSPGNLHFSMQKGRHFCAIVPHLHACFPKIV